MSSSPPDISSLSLHSRPSQQRLHDTYDYDGTRNQFHFATTQGLQQSPYNNVSSLAASISHTAIKKPVRSGLPTVCLLDRAR